MIEIGGFLGLASHYQRFIKYFSCIKESMTKLTRKDVKFVWTDKCEEACQKLKHLLSNGPMLVVPDGNQDLVVFTDAYGSRLGTVLI